MNQPRQKHLHTSPRRPFTVEEDARLIEIMNHNHFTSWRNVANQMSNRTSRQCRERWSNYLSPSIRNDPWTSTEDNLLVEKLNENGHSWSVLCRFFNGRSENDVKNRWYSHLRYQTIMVDDKYKMVDSSESVLLPERKKRSRQRAKPQEDALHFLETVTNPDTDNKLNNTIREVCRNDNLNFVSELSISNLICNINSIKEDDHYFV